MEDQSDSLVIWRIVDGKAGHESQTAGLVQALADVRAVECYDFRAGSRIRSFFNWVLGCFEPGKGLPAPDLVIGAGHRTHLSLLAARRAFGGRTVVLMTPTLPICWFDLCLIPEHDKPKERLNVERTYGVLNTVVPGENAALDRGLFLIGGPSAHHSWSEARLVEQILTVLRLGRQIQWVLTTSRRTPDSMVTALLALDEPNLVVVPYAKTQSGWVAERLQECKLVWVSEDSVSMVFEALTAGASVGVLEVPRKKEQSRVVRSLQSLEDAGYVARFGESLDTSSEARPEFCEAKRCAARVIDLIRDSEL
ncbi:MAG: mitochondrial fission ELM1 family protein [Lentimonas sp.]